MNPHVYSPNYSPLSLVVPEEIEEMCKKSEKIAKTKSSLTLEALIARA